MNEKNKKITTGFFQKRALFKLAAVFVLCVVLFNASIGFHLNQNGRLAMDFSASPQKAQAVAPLLIWGGVAAAGAIAAYFGGAAIAKNTFFIAMNAILYYGVLIPVSWILGAAGLLMDMMLSPIIFDKVVRNNTAVLEIWKSVRDLLNIVFMMVLLFSAFCTVFQYEKYHLMKKSIILNVVLMALLVNFSFPIARFIIDISNVMGYYFLDQMLPNGNVSGQFAAFSHIIDFIVPKKITGDVAITTQIVMAIIFTGILAFTFLVVGVTFVLRAVLLAILIMFSPIAFAGGVIEGKLKEYYETWWKSIFQYAFFFPIMTFALYVALKVAEATAGNATPNGDMFKDFTAESIKNGGSEMIATIAYFTIPIVIIWVGYAMALKTGGEIGSMGSNFVKGAGKKMKSWGAKGAYRAATRVAPKTTGKMEAKLQNFKDKWSGKTGKHVEARDAARDEEAAVLKARRKAKENGKDPNEAEGRERAKFKEKKNREKIKLEQEDWEGKTIKSIVDEIEKIEKGLQDGSLKPDQETMNKLAGLRGAAKGDNKAYEDEMKSRVKSGSAYEPAHPYSAPQPAYDEAGHQTAMADFKAQYTRPPAGLTPGALATWNQERSNMQAELKVFEDEKKMLDKWKKEEKEYYQEEASKLMKEHAKYSSKAIRGGN